MSYLTEILLRFSFAILVIIIARSFFIKYKLSLKGEAAIRKERLKFFFGLAVILIPIFEPIFQREKLPPDYLKLNKPYLEAILIIDEITERAVKFHFTIKNLGKLPAENIVYNIYSNTSSSYEIKPVYNRELAPGGKMSYTPDFNIFLSGNEKVFVVELGVFYKTFINNVENDYRILFHYKIPKLNLIKGIYDYDSKHEEIGFKPKMQLAFVSKHTDKILESPEGAFSFSFDEKDQHETGISSFYSSPTKEILFDPKNKLIVFKVKIADKVIVLRKNYYKPSITFHNVAVGWNINQKDFHLFVDGN